MGVFYWKTLRHCLGELNAFKFETFQQAAQLKVLTLSKIEIPEPI